LLVLAATVVGFGVRLAIGLTAGSPTTDETAYLESGISLVDGHGFARAGRPELHFPPFVPLLLGLASKVFDDPHTGTIVLTIVCGTALVVPLALLGRRLAGVPGGVATAWVAALAPGLATTPAARGAGTEAEYTLLVVGAVALAVAAVDRSGPRRLLCAAGSGGLIGLAYLTRPEGLFVAVPLFVIMFWRAGRFGGRAAAPAALAFLVPIVLCVAPYAAYLHSHTGTWELTAKTQDASIDAWRAVAGNDRQSRDAVLYHLDRTGLAFDAGRTPLTSLARHDPGGYAGIVGTNVVNLGRNLGGWWLLPLPFWLLAALGAWRLRASRAVRLMVAVAAVPVATALAFFVQPRYLVVTVALASVLVGAALTTLSARHRRWMVPVGAALLVVCSASAFYGPGGWGHPVDRVDQRRAGEWLAAHSDPEDRVMTRSYIVEYYAHRTTLAIPYADLDRIVAFGQHYGARYLVVDQYTVQTLRPQLEPLAERDRVPGLRLVHEVRTEGRTTRVFAFVPAPPATAAVGPSLGFMGDGLA
jgi:hypothetical protein